MGGEGGCGFFPYRGNLWLRALCRIARSIVRMQVVEQALDVVEARQIAASSVSLRFGRRNTHGLSREASHGRLSALAH